MQKILMLVTTLLLTACDFSERTIEAPPPPATKPGVPVVVTPGARAFGWNWAGFAGPPGYAEAHLAPADVGFEIVVASPTPFSGVKLGVSCPVPPAGTWTTFTAYRNGAASAAGAPALADTTKALCQDGTVTWQTPRDWVKGPSWGTAWLADYYVMRIGTAGGLWGGQPDAVLRRLEIIP